MFISLTGGRSHDAHSFAMRLRSLYLAGALAGAAIAADVISTNGFTTCGGGGDIEVKKLNISYNKGSNEVTFDVAGTSEKEQKVMATLIVTAYGQEVYRNSFNPCDQDISQLCPSKLLFEHVFLRTTLTSP